MKILILGCGWVGEAFARRMQSLGHEVYATITQEEKYHRLQGDGIFAIKADFDGQWELEDFPIEVDYVLNSVPAVKRLEKVVLKQRFDQVYQLLSTIRYQRHIYLSSIGVYPDVDGVFTESSVVEDSNLLQVERMMKKLDNTFIYRLGGLFGQQRIFAKYFQGRVCETGAQVANFVHQDDVLDLIRLGFEKGLKGQLYNVVAPKHVLKKDVIEASAEKYGFTKPSSYNDTAIFRKEVKGYMLQKELNYTFKYPCPLDF